METSLGNFFNTTFNQQIAVHPGSEYMTSHDANPKFVLKKEGKYAHELDVTKIENYDIGIPFVVDQRALLSNDYQMTVSLIDQNYLANNNLSAITSNFSPGLVNSILAVNPDIIDNSDVKAFIIELKATADYIKNNITQYSGGAANPVSYDNALLAEFEKLYFLNQEKFQNFYLWANSKKIIKTQTVNLSDYLEIEKIQSDVVDKDIVNIGDYEDHELFGRCYDFNLKAVQPNTTLSQTNLNEFESYIKPSKFHQINTSNSLNGENFSSKKLVKKIYNHLNDPAQYFKGRDIFGNLYNQIRGSFIASDLEELDDLHTLRETHYNTELADRLIDAVVSSKTLLNKINQNIEADPDLGSSHYDLIRGERLELENRKKQDVNYVQVVSPSSRRYKKLYVYFNLTQSQLNTVKGDKFTVDVKIGNKIFSHEQFYYAISERFKNYLFSQFNQNDIVITQRCPSSSQNYLIIQNRSPFDIKCNIEVIKRVGTEERFKEDVEISKTVTKNNIQICYLNDYGEFHGNSSNMLFRYSLEVFIGNSTYQIDSFKTLKIVQDNPVMSINKKCAVFAYQLDLVNDDEIVDLNSSSDESIHNRIVLYCNDGNFLSAKYYKRDVTYSDATEYEELLDVDGNKLGFVAAKSLNDTFYSRANNTFEYIAEIMTVQGYTYFSSPFRISINKLPSGYVNCSLTGGGINLQKTSEPTSFIQQIFDIIKNDKEEGLYNDDLKAINQATKDILFAEVEVLKYSTNSNSFYYKSLGDFSPGELVTFKSKTKSLIGSNFIKITPYQSSPILVINLVNDLISKISNDTASAGNAVEQSILLSKLKPVIDEFKNENRVNLLSSEFLQDGIIPSAETVTDLLTGLEKIKKSVKLNDVRLILSESDEYVKQNNSPLTNISVSSCLYMRLEDYRIYINFNLNMPEDNIDQIDFYIVMSEKEKILTPVTAISANKTTNFGFFDTTSLTYSGEIRYFLVPVLMTGQFKESIFLKSIIINEYRSV